MLLVALGSKLRDVLDDELAAAGITLRHLGPLGHLAASPDLSTSDLARRARVTPQSMRATVDQLERIGAVEHRRHGQGRASQLVVTEVGTSLLERARQIVAGVDEALLADVDDPELMHRTALALVMDLFTRQANEPPLP